MRLPDQMPARPSRTDAVAANMRDVALEGDGIEPAGCCAQACVNTPLGQVCQCVLDTPFC